MQHADLALGHTTNAQAAFIDVVLRVEGLAAAQVEAIERFAFYDRVGGASLIVQTRRAERVWQRDRLQGRGRAGAMSPPGRPKGEFRSAEHEGTPMIDADPAAPGSRAFAQSMRGSNQQGMRQFNERTVLQAIRLHGAIPKADLARLTQLSTQTVSIIVERLLDDDLLRKQERVRGKHRPTLGAAVAEPGRRIQHRHPGRPAQHRGAGARLRRKHPSPTGTAVRGARPRRGAAQHRRRAQDRASQARHALAARRRPRPHGAAVHAPVADILGPAAAPALARWEGVDLRERVQAMTELPVVFAKDTIAACTAELLQGQGQHVRSFLYVFVGTFVGGGLVLGGHLLTGADGNAGAIGSLPLGLAAAGRPAQLLERASGWQLEQALIGAGVDPLRIFDDAITDAEFDALTEPWLAGAADALAMTIVAASALLDLHAVVLDGSMSRRLLERLLERIRAALGAYPAVGIEAPGRLEIGRVGIHARALGAALLPLHTQFFPDKDTFLKQDA